MRWPNSRAVVALTLIGLAVMPTAGCGPATDPTPARAETFAPVAVSRVITIKPERATIRRTTAQPGQVEASEVTSMHAKVSGYVRSLAVDIGDKVKKGQVLAELDVPEVEAELQQKRALVEQAEADRKQAEAAVRVAEAAVASAKAKGTEVQAGIRRTEADVARWQAEFGRIEQLVRESAVTRSLLDETRSKQSAAQAARDEVRAQVTSAEAAQVQAVAEADKARADVVSAAARVDVAKAEARRVEAMVRYTKIEAPFDGVVIRRNFDTGHLTMPGASGDPLFVVARSDVVTVSVGVPEVDAPLVGVGDAAEVRLQALDGRTFKGKVTRTSWSLDPATRTLRAEIDLPNTDDVLLPGLYAYATIVGDEHADALCVPTSAVVRDGATSYCVIVADGRAARRPVAIGLSDGSKTEVVSGLEGGEAVVKANAASLADGQAVAVAVPERPPGAKP